MQSSVGGGPTALQASAGTRGSAWRTGLHIPGWTVLPPEPAGAGTGSGAQPGPMLGEVLTSDFSRPFSRILLGRICL